MWTIIKKKDKNETQGYTLLTTNAYDESPYSHLRHNHDGASRCQSRLWGIGGIADSTSTTAGNADTVEVEFAVSS